MDTIKKNILDRILPDTFTNRITSREVLRMLKNIDGNIFGNECVVWKGHLTNVNNPRKGIHINFFFRDKKLALHRLLYHNLVEHIEKSTYIAYTCKNKGKCLCLKHMKHKKKEYIYKESKKELKKDNKLQFKDNSFKIYFD